jgi:hypothetical protein
MVILSQQQVATFPVWDGELELWQPEEATYRESRDNDGSGPTGPLVQYEIPTETCPWTEDMVQELWDAMTQENVVLIEEARREWQEVKEFNDHIETMEQEVVDYEEPSYFNQWDQSIGLSTLIRDAKGEARQFTPEMLFQHDNLNDMWNKNCQLEDENTPGGQIWTKTRSMLPGHVPDIHTCLEFVSVGDAFGVAKCEYGSVFVPKSSIKHMKNLLGGNPPTVGNKFDAWISYAGAKYPWRIEPTAGVTEVY